MDIEPICLLCTSRNNNNNDDDDNNNKHDNNNNDNDNNNDNNISRLQASILCKIIYYTWIPYTKKNKKRELEYKLKDLA